MITMHRFTMHRFSLVWPPLPHKRKSLVQELVWRDLKKHCTTQRQVSHTLHCLVSVSKALRVLSICLDNH